MRHILIAALILGCLTEVIFAARNGVFEFNDDQGNCWSCEPGVACRRCSRNNQRNGDPECPAPNCDDPNVNRGELFPSTTLRFYYQCMPDGAGNWFPIRMECPCDLLFDPATQRCTYPFAFVPQCNFTISDPTVIDCAVGETTTLEDTTTTDPNASTTTDPNASTTTDPNGTTTLDPNAVTTTTRAPCVCVIWFPCPCNPCFMSRHPSCMMMRG